MFIGAQKIKMLHKIVFISMQYKPVIKINNTAFIQIVGVGYMIFFFIQLRSQMKLYT